MIYTYTCRPLFADDPAAICLTSADQLELAQSRDICLDAPMRSTIIDSLRLPARRRPACNLVGEGRAGQKGGGGRSGLTPPGKILLSVRNRGFRGLADSDIK